MRCAWTFVTALYGASAISVFAARVEPRITSVHPFTTSKGVSFSASLRGTGIQGARAVYVEGAPFRATVSNVEERQAQIRFEIDADSKPGIYYFRLITDGGVSNALPINIAEHAVVREPDGSHETPETAAGLAPGPAIVVGRIDRKGESDYYVFDAKAGETITFQAISGLPSIGGPGGNANGFDPSLSIHEESGSWFDSKRLKRIAFNDEPLWVAGQLTHAHIVHRFARSGRYWLRVEAFSGQGGPDYSYQLKVLPGEHRPPDQSVSKGDWDERSFQRGLPGERMNELADRGGKARNQKVAETYRPGAAMKLPATLEGSLAQPGQSQQASFSLDGPQDIAIEIETPRSAPPLFNPVVRLLDSEGVEVATNIFVGKGACTGAMTKSIQAKTIVPLRNPGGYRVEIRDATADLAGSDFAYRVHIRPQVPHVGQVRVEEDHVNLVPGDSKSIRVTFDREEDYRGAIAVEVQGLPSGVQAFAGADFEPDKDPPIFVAKRERYTARAERTVVVFSAAPGTSATEQPVFARVVARTLVDGKLGSVLTEKRIPIMVVANP